MSEFIDQIVKPSVWLAVGFLAVYGFFCIVGGH